MATDIKIKQDDIDALARKLDELGEVLTPKERGILLAVFKLASAQLAKQAGKESESAGIMVPTINAISGLGSLANVPSLSSAFKDAFKPLDPGGVGGLAAIDIDVHIGW
jgi:hypothetical protein